MGQTSRRFHAAPGLAWVLVAAAAVIAGGCAPSKKQAAARPGSAANPPAMSKAAKAGSKEARTSPRPGGGGSSGPLTATDPCAIRLHDISGMLLLYYVTNHRLPERLEELAPFADADVGFDPTCPESGRPYVYVPGGLADSGGGRVLLVYDAVGAHAGVRWVIVASPPEGDQPLATWVMPYTEERFRRHVPRAGG